MTALTALAFSLSILAVPAAAQTDDSTLPLHFAGDPADCKHLGDSGSVLCWTKTPKPQPAEFDLYFDCHDTDHDGLTDRCTAWAASTERHAYTFYNQIVTPPKQDVRVSRRDNLGRRYWVTVAKHLRIDGRRDMGGDCNIEDSFGPTMPYENSWHLRNVNIAKRANTGIAYGWGGHSSADHPPICVPPLGGQWVGPSAVTGTYPGVIKIMTYCTHGNGWNNTHTNATQGAPATVTLPSCPSGRAVASAYVDECNSVAFCAIRDTVQTYEVRVRKQ